MHNISEITLLSNSPVNYTRTFRGVVQTFVFHIPTLKEMYSSCYDFYVFRTLCEGKLEKLSKDLHKKFETRMELFLYVLSLPESNRIRQNLEYFLKLCWKEYRLVDGFLVNKYRVDEEVVDFFCTLLRLGIGSLTLKEFLEYYNNNDTEMTPEEREWKRREEEYKSKIASVKNSDKAEGIDIQMMLLTVSYDFRISLEELMEKNFYTILAFYGQSWKIDSYKVQLAMYGNSFAKIKGKHKHWKDYKN